eukprot:2330406-Prymnesium_polylepis.2
MERIMEMVRPWRDFSVTAPYTDTVHRTRCRGDSSTRGPNVTEFLRGTPPAPTRPNGVGRSA